MRFIFLLIFFNVPLFSQNGLEKTYYDNNKVESEVNYVQGVRTGEAKFYYENGNVKEEFNYLNGRIDGLIKKYTKEGKLFETFNIENGKRNGPTSLFDSMGVYVRDIFFVNGKLEVDDTPIYVDKDIPKQEPKNETSTQVAVQQHKRVKKPADQMELPPSIVEENSGDDPAYYLTAEVMPRPVGGMAVIYKKLVYPKAARDKDIQGVVKIRAFVDEWGEVTKADIEEGIGYGCDDAAKIAVYYTKFKPAVQKGKKIKAQVVVPVEFKIY